MKCVDIRRWLVGGGTIKYLYWTQLSYYSYSPHWGSMKLSLGVHFDTSLGILYSNTFLYLSIKTFRMGGFYLHSEYWRISEMVFMMLIEMFRKCILMIILKNLFLMKHSRSPISIPSCLTIIFVDVPSFSHSVHTPL